MTHARKALAAGGNLPGCDALTEIRLRHPTRVEDLLEVGLGDGVRSQEDRVDLVVARRREDRRALDLAHIGVTAELHRSLAGTLAEPARVLPDVDRLGAERDAVEGGLVAVLTGHRDLARKALCRERCDYAAGHTVVLREDRIDGVLVGREDLLHVRLGLRRVPVVRIDLADDLDIAG